MESGRATTYRTNPQLLSRRNGRATMARRPILEPEPPETDPELEKTIAELIERKYAAPEGSGFPVTFYDLSITPHGQHGQTP